MPNYKIFGTKYFSYQTDVVAEDEYQAIEIANALPATDWQQMENDDVIEATDVFLDDDLVIQLKKGIS